MKKTILVVGLIIALASCVPVVRETTPVVDSTVVVAVNPAATVSVDSILKIVATPIVK